MSSRTQPVANFTPHGDQLNVLFIVSDQERGWHLYPTGFFDTYTPARAWLRDHGVHFTGFNTPTPICSTARGLIYSGLHSMNNGVFDNVPLPYASPLRTDVATLGTAFMDAGYLTGYAGKWHLSRMHEQVTDSAEAQANNATRPNWKRRATARLRGGVTTPAPWITPHASWPDTPTMSSRGCSP
jgi:arylsulfatase A-like enzyme